MISCETSNLLLRDRGGEGEKGRGKEKFTLFPLDENMQFLFVHQFTNPLVVISQIRPIYVTFTIPQRLLPDLSKYKARGKLEVDALIPNEQEHPVRGELTFVDSGVDSTTGTIQLKGSFANTQERLTPGQFVKVVLKLAEKPNAIA